MLEVWLGYRNLLLRTLLIKLIKSICIKDEHLISQGVKMSTF